MENGQKVLVTIKGMQGELGENEIVEMTTTGTMYDKNGTLYVNYIDTYLDDEVETKTTIKVKEDKITVIRYGAASTTMIFEKDKEQIMAYETGFGVFEIITNTKNIDISRKNDSLEVIVSYSLEVNHNSMGLSNFEMYATPVL